MKPGTSATQSTTAKHIHTGQVGESLAARYLANKGYDLITRNWRGSRGEIDLVLVDGSELVVVEVKTRSSGIHGSPLEAIDETKLRRLYRLALEFRRVHQLQCGVRVDGVAVMGSGNRYQIDHRKNLVP